MSTASSERCSPDKQGPYPWYRGYKPDTMRSLLGLSSGLLTLSLLLPRAASAQTPPAAPHATAAPATAPAAAPVAAPARPTPAPGAVAEVTADLARAIADGALMQIASENVSRIRRATVFGPHLSGFGAYQHDAGALDGAVSAGLGLYFYSIPLTIDVPGFVKEAAKQRLSEKIKALADAGTPPSADDVKALGRQIYRDARDEFLGARHREGKTFEAPSSGVYVDLGRQFREKAWQLRFSPSVGVSYVNVGLVLGVSFGDKLAGILGGEASLRAMPGHGPRANQIEPFVRVEWHKEKGGGEVQSVLGLRLTLDLI